MFTDLIEREPSRLMWTLAQQLAWLLGQSAAYYHENAESLDEQQGSFFPDDKAWGTELDRLIGEARRREAGQPIPRPLFDLIQRKRDFWKTRYRMLLERSPGSEGAAARLAVLLPSQQELDRLLRYEKHATSSLFRSIEMLAKLRGVSLKSVLERVTRTNDPAGAVIENERVEMRRSHTMLAGPN